MHGSGGFPLGRDDDLRRRREREDEVDEALRSKLKSGDEYRTHKSTLPSGDTTEKLLELLERMEPMVEQLNNLYTMYLQGVDRLPPIERRKQLDQVALTIHMMPKPTPALMFRANNALNHYNTNKERWDRMLKQKERK
jgi:hypothetical protein